MGYGHNILLYPCVEMPRCSTVQLIFANTKVKTRKENIQTREQWLVVQGSWGEWWEQLCALGLEGGGANKLAGRLSSGVGKPRV